MKVALIPILGRFSGIQMIPTKFPDDMDLLNTLARERVTLICKGFEKIKCEDGKTYNGLVFETVKLIEVVP